MSENTASSRNSTLLTAGVLVIALAAVFLAGLQVADDGDDAAPAASTTETFGIVTSGEGKATGTPDQLSFTASVTNTKPTTKEAMEATNHDVRAVTIRAKKAGVAAKDIRTTGVTIRAKYDYRGKGGRKLVGYTSSEKVRIMVRNLDKAGTTIGDVTTAAGNAVSIGSVALSISNQDELIAQARTKAVKKSKAAAEALAEAAGRDVGKLEFVAEVEPDRYRYGGYNELSATVDGNFAMAVPASAVRGSVPISPGEQKLSVTVQVRWSLD